MRTSRILAWGKGCVFTLCKHNWILLINQAFFVVVVAVLDLIFALFLFLFISHYFTKTVHRPGPWQGVHGPGPRWGSIDPWSIFCPYFVLISKQFRLSHNQKDMVTVHSYFVTHFISLLHLIRHKYINFLTNSFFESRKSCHQTL